MLTALEALRLNLWGTKLVALSACDTGVGEVRNGDGVYGLRRAFVLAGAESLVMSLWPVSDTWTERQMRSYYQNLRRINDAPVAFLFHALRGRPVLVRDPQLLADVMERTARDYHDRAPLLARATREAFAR